MLHLNYRPESLYEVYGNEKLVKSLASIIKRDKNKIPHSFLFTGPKGCGKTTMARIMAHELDCQGFNQKEINCSNHRKIEDARAIIDSANLSSLGESKNKGWILDEFHLFGEGGNSPKNKPQNALLKLLEEPPEHAFFFLCSTNPEDILGTIKSRCSIFEVEVLERRDLLQLLKKVCKKERKRVGKDILNQIIKGSEGHPRDALTALDQIIDLDPEEQEEALDKIILQESQVIDLCNGLINAKGWDKIRDILFRFKGQDPEKVRYAVLNYCNSVLLKEDHPLAFVIMDAFKEPFYNTGFPGLTMASYDACKAVEEDDEEEIPF